ncbi:MAG: anti-sigma factor [Coleofasciculaceae cyanobacterium SM2_1_6]|nr:anti-sigma factor [Coleofasciculaceae cyanobacterium SM2_1_6]
MNEPLSPRIEELLAGYALGDLSSEEAAELQQILVEHPDLEIELQSLQEVLATLPYALPAIEPSPQLRQDILASLDHASIDRPSPIAPVTNSPNSNLSIAPALPLDISANIPPNIASNNQPLPVVPPVGIPRNWSRISQIPVPGLKLAGGIAALVTVALGFDNYRLRQQLASIQGQVDRQKDVIAMLQQPKTRLVSLKGMDDMVKASGSIVVTPGEPQAVLILRNLPPLPRGQSYQLWNIIDEQKIPWQQFQVNQQGVALTKLVLPSSYAVTKLAITIELSPDPPVPTGPMVMVSDL